MVATIIAAAVAAAAALLGSVGVHGQECTTDQRLTITEDGEQTIVWVKSAGKNNRGITVTGGNLTMEHGPRAYLVSDCSTSVTPATFKKLLWNDSKTLSYTVDLSQVGCACNAALYMVAMPYSDKDTCGDYYCDANFKGCHCPEMDIRAPSHACLPTRRTLQLTPWHRCSTCRGGEHARVGGHATQLHRPQAPLYGLR